MNIEIRKAGKKKKYYLAHSFREGKKVKKIRRYLGADLNKQKLEALKKRAEEILKLQIESYKTIRNPLKSQLSEHEIALIKKLISRNPIKIKHLSEEEWKEFSELFIYNTNAIEGSEATLKEVKDILENDKWSEELTKDDISETYGVNEAIEFIRKDREHISLEFIKKLHKIVFKNSKHFAGSFRERGVEVVIKNSLGDIVHTGAPAKNVKKLLEELIEWYNKNKNKYHGLILSVVIHNQFETIHPFADGNGRVGRLLLNNILLKHNLPPVNINLENRREYYAALREYQKRGNLRPMIELILKEYKILRKRLG